jgi:hypothetical protein
VSTEENLDAELPEELKSLEAALRQLTPAASQIDRDRLMYQAGRASVLSTGDAGVALERQMSVMDRRQNYWPMATAVLVLLSITLGGLWLHATRSSVVYVVGEPMAVLPNEIANPAVSEVLAHRGADYLRLRNLVLAHGTNALPATPVSNSTSDIPTQLNLPDIRQPLLDKEF